MSLGSQISPYLPLLRRFARTLLGNQRDGDHYVTLALEAIADKRTLPSDVDVRLGLYRIFLEQVGPSIDRPTPQSGSDLESIAHQRLSKLPNDSLRALLLTSVEGFSVEDSAYLLDHTRSEVKR